MCIFVTVTLQLHFAYTFSRQKRNQLILITICSPQNLKFKLVLFKEGESNKKNIKEVHSHLVVYSNVVSRNGKTTLSLLALETIFENHFLRQSFDDVSIISTERKVTFIASCCKLECDFSIFSSLIENL